MSDKEEPEPEPLPDFSELMIGPDDEELHGLIQSDFPIPVEVDLDADLFDDDDDEE